MRSSGKGVLSLMFQWNQFCLDQIIVPGRKDILHCFAIIHSFFSAWKEKEEKEEKEGEGEKREKREEKRSRS